ncbi:MAG TPA: hypothetical protein PKE27_11825 [Povalibacter sp.]|uniref:hypothetical protein n=1 Tax=Povalibacter sp. TaxID=1962978 RepID=UPI002BAFC84B|nr:hypothetical protein [Povalibacter sp.]HMN45260.1 hypothetical protein [Povalibacter sp.]
MDSSSDIYGLSSAERFVIWGLRLGLSPQISGDTAREALITGFRAARVSAALPYFNEVTDALATIWHQLHYVPEIHCTCCSCIGHEEWLLMQAIAALQYRDVSLAVRYLSAMLPEAGVRIVLHRAMHVAAILSSAGWTLRCVRLDAVNASSFAMPGDGASLLH